MSPSAPGTRSSVGNAQLSKGEMDSAQALFEKHHIDFLRKKHNIQKQYGHVLEEFGVHCGSVM